MKTKTFHRKLAFAAALAGTALASPAMADAITMGADDIGTSFTLNYDGYSGGTTVSGLTGSATFTLTDITATSYIFSYSVSNTSSSGITSSISSFAFNTNPDIDGASSTGAYNFAVTGSKYPNGIGTVDVCFKAASSASCGGNSGGITAGATGTGTLSLDFFDVPTELTLSDFYLRYQGIEGAGNITSASGTGTLTSSGGGTTGGGTTGGTTTSGGTSVPEPGMLGMFGAALIGVALMRRRRKPELAIA